LNYDRVEFLEYGLAGHVIAATGDFELGQLGVPAGLGGRFDFYYRLNTEREYIEVFVSGLLVFFVFEKIVAFKFKSVY
jgi:hypothetical protein